MSPGDRFKLPDGKECEIVTVPEEGGVTVLLGAEDDDPRPLWVVTDRTKLKPI